MALLVEPTPFTHVSGYSNRFKEMLRFLKAGGDDAEVITPDDSPERPNNFLGMPITYVPGFRLIFYKQVRAASCRVRRPARRRPTRSSLAVCVWAGAAHAGRRVPCAPAAACAPSQLDTRGDAWLLRDPGDPL